MPPNVNVPGDQPQLSTLYKVTQRLPNGAIICKVFDPTNGMTWLTDLFSGVDSNQTKTVEISSLQLDLKKVNLEDFFKTGGALFSTADIK